MIRRPIKPSCARFRVPVPEGPIVPALLLAALAAIAVAAPVSAACPSLPDPQLRALDRLVGRDAKQALAEIGARVSGLESLPGTTPQKLAALYALQANAYSMLELDRDARDAATNGLALATNPLDPVHVNLLIGYWGNIYDQAGLDQAVQELEAARALQPPGSSAAVCLLIELGVVQQRRDRPDIAISELTQAYSMTAGPAAADERVLAAAGLASVMRAVGDHAQSLALNQEVIAYDTARGATLDLSVARFLRGETLTSMGDYDGAMEQLTLARELSVGLDDRQGVAFADQALCRANIERGQPTRARPQCEQALRVFTAARSTDVALQTQALIARIDLAEGHAERALAKLNGILANGGVEIPARDLVEILELRARTNATLQDYASAYQDLREYLRRYRAVNDTERSRQMTTLRARLETDREIERNGALQRELSLSHDRATSQATELRRTQLAIAAGTIVIGLLIYILVSGLRNRQLLMRLASLDGLTSLPNRRRTIELATNSLQEAAADGRPVTIALLDFDHFKQINDRCGHAAGDYALKEFARKGRELLRAEDTLGRWGGEEFLLVLPNCPLDLAYECVERLRAAAMAIELPFNEAKLHVSVSAGLATNIRSSMSLDEIVASADAALYEAKGAGRDLVRIARDSFGAASTGVRLALNQGLAATAAANR
jgi:diguanylate cyclase (GGDEF)-like protein